MPCERRVQICRDGAPLAFLDYFFSFNGFAEGILFSTSPVVDPVFWATATPGKIISCPAWGCQIGFGSRLELCQCCHEGGWRDTLDISSRSFGTLDPHITISAGSWSRWNCGKHWQTIVLVGGCVLLFLVCSNQTWLVWFRERFAGNLIFG